jgi:hypothetical protein
LITVTSALAEPPGPVAVTVAEPEPVQVAGAVYSPVLPTVPSVAVQVVAPVDVNCCVAPRSRLTAVGRIVCGGMGTRVTAALAEPPGPVAVTVTAVDAGMVVGAVYNPVDEIVPAVAVQLVAPAEVNC